jgi:hypothetical protein
VATNPSYGVKNDGQITITVSGEITPYYYSLNGGNEVSFSTSTAIIRNLTEGVEYTVRIRSAYPGSETQTFNVTIPFYLGLQITSKDDSSYKTATFQITKSQNINLTLDAFFTPAALNDSKPLLASVVILRNDNVSVGSIGVYKSDKDLILSNGSYRVMRIKPILIKTPGTYTLKLNLNAGYPAPEINAEVSTTMQY